MVLVGIFSASFFVKTTWQSKVAGRSHDLFIKCPAHGLVHYFQLFVASGTFKQLMDQGQHETRTNWITRECLFVSFTFDRCCQFVLQKSCAKWQFYQHKCGCPLPYDPLILAYHIHPHQYNRWHVLAWHNLYLQMMYDVSFIIKRHALISKHYLNN